MEREADVAGPCRPAARSRRRTGCPCARVPIRSPRGIAAACTTCDGSSGPGVDRRRQRPGRADREEEGERDDPPQAFTLRRRTRGPRDFVRMPARVLRPASGGLDPCRRAASVSVANLDRVERQDAAARPRDARGAASSGTAARRTPSRAAPRRAGAGRGAARAAPSPSAGRGRGRESTSAQRVPAVREARLGRRGGRRDRDHGGRQLGPGEIALRHHPRPALARAANSGARPTDAPRVDPSTAVER